MAIRYRQLQAPAAVDTRFVDDGSADTANALASAFKSFQNVAYTVEAGRAIDKGAQAGAAQGATGNEQPLKGWKSYTLYGQAYNNAAMLSYAVKAEADAEDQAARLEVEAANDPEKFKATYGAVRDATVKAAPVEARPVLNEIYNRRLGDSTARLRNAQMVEMRKQNLEAVSEGIARAVDRVSIARASDDPAKQQEADEEEAKIRLLIDGAERDGTLSATAAGSARVEAMRAVTSQTVVARFKRVLDDPYGNPLEFITRLKKANETSEALPPAEEAKLIDSLFSELREHNALNAAASAAMANDEKARYEAGDREATGLMLAGQLTRKKLLDMVASQDLKPEVARTLNNELEANALNGGGVDNPRIAFHVGVNLLDYTEDDITYMNGLSWKTRREMILERRKEAQGWKGTQAAREGKERIDRALGIPEGGINAILAPELAKQRDLAMTEWYNTVDMLEPNERQAAVISSAETVIGKFIRKNKASQAQSLRRLKNNFMQGKNPDKMGKEERKVYQERVSKYDTDIAAAEAEAARQ